ncbi:hypothetical protein [Roseateles puraquae]|uniref:PNPLA domain-containing protein n=1 Tax=Roseateles puraquae TaxID=431059 RepID=A0A254NF25_9BURK|nr:hypothetical protein [Roseateles puraquae]MDG0852748.1 hypothetical protein [Roseateles puraquae]OWR05452.1 hypothetical protein CDO81_03040 [Roseateles puraquae]
MAISLTTTVTTTPPLTVSQFYTPAGATPGNVGLCLSGGGTRAACAAMGQLRGLSYLQANGASLLSQVKALSTVSGGSWLGVPYMYMPASGSDDTTYLGTYNANQGALTVGELGSLPPGNAGNPFTSDTFSLVAIAGTAWLLYIATNKVNPADPLPANMLWQTVMGLNILSPYGLYAPRENFEPNDLFSATSESLNAILTANPALKTTTAHTFAAGSGFAQRPFHICNMGMMVSVKGLDLPPLAPVQATGYGSGVVGSPSFGPAQALDANGLPVGGGLVDSFALPSSFVSLSGDTATVQQVRPWALTDIMGTSSAAFADEIWTTIGYWQKNPPAFKAWLEKESLALLKWIDHMLSADAQRLARDILDHAASPLSASAQAHPAVAEASSFPVDLIPQYPSWPVGGTETKSGSNPNHYADGGSLDNSGLCSLLSYSDIDSAIVCINSMVPLSAASCGIPSPAGSPMGWVVGSQVLVDDTIPPLFGYQPYDDKVGYQPYPDTQPNTVPQQNRAFARNQIFAASDFAPFLRALWAAAGSKNPASGPAVLSQSLQVKANSWFGVPARRAPMTIVWVYLNYATDWAAQFDGNAAVQQLVTSELANSRFPNYSTFDTQLTATQINLMAHLTSWCVVTAEQETQVFSSLFKSPA